MSESLKGRLPTEFVRRMTQLLGEQEAASLFEALTHPSSVGLRLNTLRGPAHELLSNMPWPLAQVPWCPSGFVPDLSAAQVEGVPTPGAHPYQLAGAYYLQDPAAMTVAEALNPQSADVVLDLAAAPGGKSTHLAALLAGTGWLVANDVHPERAQALAGNLERCGVTNATVTSETPARLAQLWPGRFDRVLLDAPCSGEGMFRKSDDALAMWSEDNVRLCALRQDGLLLDAARLVKPGGYLAYSTCTLSPEENEGSVARFIAATGFELVPLSLPGCAPGRPDWSGSAPLPGLAGTVRVWPHLAVGEGHFVALMRRPEGERSGQPGEAPGGSEVTGTRRAKRNHAEPLPRQALQAWQQFASGTLAAQAAAELVPTQLHNDWLLHATHAAPQARWLRHGLQLGEVRVGHRSARLEPAHALAMALPGQQVMNRLSLDPDDDRVRRYMRGEEIEASGDQGYVRVEVSGLPLGWGKRGGTSVRSLLPKGLRRNL